MYLLVTGLKMLSVPTGSLLYVSLTLKHLGDLMQVLEFIFCLSFL